MKKLLILMISLLSFAIVYFSFQDVNQNQATNVYLLEKMVEQSIDEDMYDINIQMNKTYPFRDIINVVTEFVSENKLTCIANNEYKDDEGVYNINDFYILSSNTQVLKNYLITGETIDFSLLTEKKYYSTHEDQNAAGLIKILNNGYFDLAQEIYRFKQFKNIEEIQYNKMESINLSIYSKNNKFVKELETTLNKQFPDTHIEDLSLGTDHIHSMIDQQFIEKNQTRFFEMTIIVSIILLTMTVIKDTKKYMIRRMMGTSVLKITFKEYFGLLLICQICFSLVLTFTFYYLCPESNIITQEFYNQIFPFHFYCLEILLIMFIIIYVFIYFTSHVKYLHTQNHYKYLYHIQIIMKVIVVTILMAPLMTSFQTISPYVMNYLTISKVKDDVENLYYLNCIPNNSKEIFNYYIDKTDYIDFNDYYSNSALLSLNNDVENDFLMKYPYIHVNAHYLKKYDIRDLNNNKLDLDEYQENVLLVPEKYKSKDLSRYYPSKTSPIIYIKNSGEFINLRIEEPFVVKNPIIYLEKEYEMAETKMTGFSFRTSQFSELQNQLKKLEGNDVLLVSSKYKYNYYTYMFQQSIIELLMNISIYLTVYLTLMIQSLLLYLDEKGKEISIGYTLGINKCKRYLEIFAFNIGSYIAIYIGSISFEIAMVDKIKFMSLFAFIEILIEIMFIHYFEKTRIVSCIKGEKIR